MGAPQEIVASSLQAIGQFEQSQRALRAAPAPQATTQPAGAANASFIPADPEVAARIKASEAKIATETAALRGLSIEQARQERVDADQLAIPTADAISRLITTNIKGLTQPTFTAGDPSIADSVATQVEAGLSSMTPVQRAAIARVFSQPGNPIRQQLLELRAASAGVGTVGAQTKAAYIAAYDKILSLLANTGGAFVLPNAVGSAATSVPASAPASSPVSGGRGRGSAAAGLGLGGN
jgi:hypothetical protein